MKRQPKAVSSVLLAHCLIAMVSIGYVRLPVQPVLAEEVEIFYPDLQMSSSDRRGDMQISPGFLRLIPARKWDIINRKVDVNVLVGQQVSKWLLSVWCDPAMAQKTGLKFSSSSPYFSLGSHPDTIECGSEYGVAFWFTPDKDGLVENMVTVQSDLETTSIKLLGNGVPIVKPKYWIKTLPENTRAEMLVYDASRDRVYIPDSLNHRVLACSPTKNSEVHSIPTGSGPVSAAISADGKRLYVANSTGLSVSEIDLNTLTELRRIRLRDLGDGHTPYDLAVLDDRRLLIGTAPPGMASGGPLFELDLKTAKLRARKDIGAGARPVLQSTSDFSATAILDEPIASPTPFSIYDPAYDSTQHFGFGIERGMIWNSTGSRLITSYAYAPDISIFDRMFTPVIGIYPFGYPLGMTAHPKMELIYLAGEMGIGGGVMAVIDEANLTAGRQVRQLRFQMPEGFWLRPNVKTLAVSSSGLWLYVLLQEANDHPRRSCLMGIYINR